MGRKSILGPITIASAQSLAADFESDETNVQQLDNISYQINVTTTDSIGVFYLQVSLDNINFSDIGVAGSVAGANDVIIVDITEIAEPYIRLRYDSSTAGTGTCKIMLNAKVLGA